MTFISNKMRPLHIIQEQSKSILMKHFLRNGLVEEVQLIGQHIHLTIFFLWDGGVVKNSL